MINKKLIFLMVIFGAAAVTANVLATKLWGFGQFSLPAGVIVFPIMYLITDVINEVWGVETAKKVVIYGFVATIGFTVFSLIAIALPPFQGWDMQEEFAAMFGAVPRITLAGLLAYIVSNTIDLSIFHKLKQAHGNNKLWIRNNVSTMVAQIFDTAVFVTVAFAGTMPIQALLLMMVGQLVVKIVFAAIDTPFIYLGVRWARK